MRIVGIFLILFFAGYLFAGNQITVFKSLQKANLSQFGLKVNVFPEDKVLNLNRDNKLAICESIDNSNLIIFGPQTPSTIFKKLFDDKAINNSIRELMNRNGVILFGPSSWSYLASLPESLMRFYRDHNVPEMNAKMYATREDKLGRETNMTGTPDCKYKGELLYKPNDFISNIKKPEYKLMSVRYFSNLPKNKFDILFFYKTPQVPLLIATKEKQKKGMMIFTYCYNLFSQKDHPFMGNVIRRAYGQIKKISNKEQIRKKLRETNSKKPDDISKFLIVLKGKGTASASLIKLYNWRKNSEPAKATQVKISSDSRKLYVSFVCSEPNMNGIIAKCSKQDSEIWTDDCVELFISSLDKQGDKYHYIINPKGVYYDAKNNNPRWNSKFELKSKCEDNSWQINLAIPFSELKLDSRSNFRINFCREEKQLGEITSWSKTLDLSNPSEFGYIIGKNKESLMREISAGRNTDSKGEIVVRPGKLWKRCYPDSFPKELSSELEKDIIVARNEKEPISFWISNTYDENFDFRIEPEIYISGTETPFQEVFTLKSAVPWRAATGEIFAESLVRLNEGNILTLPGLETRVLWIDVKTKLPAGDYKWHFSLVPVNSDMPTKKITINLKVLPFVFPEQLPANIYTFGPYGFSWARGDALQDKYFKTCSDYHINWVQGTEGPVRAIRRNSRGKLEVADNPEYYRGSELNIQKMNLKCVFGYGLYSHFIRRLRELGEKRTIKSPEIRKLFRQWVALWISNLKRNNFDLDNALFPLCDEPQTGIIDELVIAGQVMHEVDSKVQLTSTIPTWSTMADLKNLNKFIDVWITWEPRITSRKDAEKELAFLHKTGKKVYPYLCSNSANTSSYLNYFRYRGIRSYLMKFDGFANWAFNSWRGNEWKSSEDADKQGSWLFHHGDKGPIPTIRAEAFREGIEDLYLLRSGAELLRKKPDKKLEKLISPAHLNQLLDNCDPVEIQKWRDELISAISALK